MDGELGLLLWAVRAMLVVVTLVLLVMFAVVWRVLVIPVVSEAQRARTEGNGWAPFLRDARGQWGPLASNRWWATFRADEPGTSGALAWRWGWWAFTAVVVAGATLYCLWLWARMLVSGWS